MATAISGDEPGDNNQRDDEACEDASDVELDADHDDARDGEDEHEDDELYAICGSFPTLEDIWRYGSEEHWQRVLNLFDGDDL